MIGYKDFHIRIPNEVHAQLKILSEQRGVALKWLIVSAIEEFLRGTKEEDLETIRKEIHENRRRLMGLRSDIEVLGELFSYYIFHWIGYTPRLSKSERASLATDAQERHKRFMRKFAQRLTIGDLTLSSVLSRSSENKEE